MGRRDNAWCLSASNVFKGEIQHGKEMKSGSRNIFIGYLKTFIEVIIF